ncbi:MAG: polysaccharide biosynthesis protein [Methylococcales bacterium]|nr:polysaccharide biosynthesis protein [Methylococcales bacterium]
MIALPLRTWFVGLSRRIKASILISADSFFTAFALWAAFSLRWSDWYIPKGDEWAVFAVAPVIAVPIFIRLGLYRAIIRYIEIRALWTIIQATTLYAIIFAFILYESGIKGIPRTVSLLNWLLIILLVSSSRFFVRWWLADAHYRLGEDADESNHNKKNVVIYGAGNAGVQLASALVHGSKFKTIAFIDDNPLLHKQKINGIRIYPFDSLSYLMERYHVANVLLAMPSASRMRIREVIDSLEPYAVHVLSMPSLSDIAQGKVTFDALQEVDVADLLGRDSVAPVTALLQANVTGKVVMVTGAGGSIGSELCRQIVLLQPNTLVLFEQNEFTLYAIEKELEQQLGNDNIAILPVLGSVTSAERVEKVCKAFGVQTIYHAAAYKHVPMVEKNPAEAVWNNIIGTLHTAQAAIHTGVETFVLISTDKAVRPTNTMGATKRFAELILQAMSDNATDEQKTRFTMVRFGNVLGSSGSVVPLFREQIARGGPITVTDKRIIRYFMTIPEASQLVIQAGAMGQGGDVFVLDMGEPIRIVDLAKRMIHLSGLQIKDETHPNGDIEIQFTGLRAGEKLYEELLIGDNVSKTTHPRIMRAEESMIVWAELEKILNALTHATKEDDFEQLRMILQQAVSGFVPPREIGDLLWKQHKATHQ